MDPIPFVGAGTLRRICARMEMSEPHIDKSAVKPQGAVFEGS